MGDTGLAAGEGAIYEGAEFDSYDGFLYNFNNWSEMNEVRFVKSHSQSVEIANKLNPCNAPLESRLKYRNVVFKCIHGGAPRRRPDTSTKWRKRSLKSGCPALVNVTADRRLGKLVVRKVIQTHNHAPGESPLLKMMKVPDDDQYFNEESLDYGEEEERGASYINFFTPPASLVKPDLLDAIVTESATALGNPNIVCAHSMPQEGQSNLPFISRRPMPHEVMSDESSLDRDGASPVLRTNQQLQRSPGLENEETSPVLREWQLHQSPPDVGNREPPYMIRVAQSQPSLPDMKSRGVNPAGKPTASDVDRSQQKSTWEEPSCMMRVAQSQPRLPDVRSRGMSSSATTASNVDRSQRKSTSEGGTMDGEDYFCKGLAIQLREMDEETRSRVKVQILILAHNARFPSSSLGPENDLGSR